MALKQQPVHSHRFGKHVLYPPPLLRFLPGYLAMRMQHVLPVSQHILPVSTPAMFLHVHSSAQMILSPHNLPLAMPFGAALCLQFQLLRDAHAAAERQKLQDAEKQELQRRDAAEAVAAGKWPAHLHHGTAGVLAFSKGPFEKASTPFQAA